MDITPPYTPQPQMDRQPPSRSTALLVATGIFCVVGIIGALIWYYQQPTISPPEPNGNGGMLPPPPEDLNAPSTPTRATATAISGTEIRVSWDASTDDVGVVGYRVYRDGSLAGTTNTTSYADKTARPATEYVFVVTAYDAARHESLATQDLRVKTPVISETLDKPSSATISIKTKNSEAITLKNFYIDAVETTKDDVIVRNNNYYTLAYFPVESSFLITLHDSNVRTARAVAELELIDILGLDNSGLCQLRIFITIPFDVNEAYSKKSYGLSFCPGGESF